ncbi:helix-turn-helix domain-containing protein [Candidatus Zixiibacteriota bacterium]
MESPNHTPYLTVDQVAEHLGFNRQTIWRWAREGTIPCYRIHRKFRFKIEEVEKWVQKRRQRCRMSKEILL